MREIHYIDIDEEIISAVSRLRNSGQGENVFIFPKRALILQSIINLRLLEREANKLGKKVIVVSQDEAGRKLAEKAGLLVEEYQDQMLQGSAMKETARFVAEPASHTKTLPLPEQKSTPISLRRLSKEIGSDSFFTAEVGDTHLLPVQKPAPVSRPTPLPQKLRIRNMSPNQNPGLNSVQKLPVSAPQTGPNLPVRPLTAFSDGVTAPSKPLTRYPAPVQPIAKVPLVPPTPPQIPQDAPSPTLTRSGRLARFMGSTENTRSPAQISSRDRNTPSIQTPSQSQSSHYPWVWIVSGILLLIASTSVGFLILFPKTTVTIQPQSAEQVVRFQGTLVTDDTRGENIFPGRIATAERTVQVSVNSTGSPSDTTKARGKIRIYNSFSNENQPLVATTRFETKDGKIFRLVESVVVPGMNDTAGQKERGVIEATVVADQVGGDYNISPTTFTIPGFKGSPKYAAFTAESFQTFTGGEANSLDSQKTLVAADIERAKVQALDEAKKAVLEDLRSSLTSEEVILEDSFFANERPGATYPPLGTTQNTFTYETRFETKVFVINEAAVRERVANERLTSGNATLFPQAYTIRYTALLPKYDIGRTDVTVESTIKFQAKLDAEKIKGALLGQDENGIRQFLEKHPEIERLQVEFQPKLLIATIPKQASRVHVEIQGE